MGGPWGGSLLRGKGSRPGAAAQPYRLTIRPGAVARRSLARSLGGPALPFGPVGTIPPWSSLISAAWRQGLVVERGVLGEEEEKI
jgi:hypothetical protein